MKHVPLLAAQIARPIVAYLDANGTDPTPYLDRVRIPIEIIDAGGWVAKKQVYDLVYDVAQRERSPDVIFAAFSTFEVDDLGPIAVAMKSSRTVKDAMRVLSRLAGLAYEGNEYFLQSDGETTWLCYREGKPVSIGSVLAQQATLGIFLKIIRLSADPHWQPRQIRSQVPMSEDFRAADDWSDCRQMHGSNHTAIAIPTRFMHRKVAWAEEPQSSGNGDMLWKFERAFDDRFVESLHRLIASRFLFRSLPTLRQIAAIVGLSERTIKRRLSSQGLSYRHLIDRVCHDAACEMLLDENMSVREIAVFLGYPDTSKFARSFRRMTGVTPGQFRRFNG
jgi:AraC-like DNA-binding protein